MKRSALGTLAVLCTAAQTVFLKIGYALLL